MIEETTVAIVVAMTVVMTGEIETEVVTETPMATPMAGEAMLGLHHHNHYRHQLATAGGGTRTTRCRGLLTPLSLPTVTPEAGEAIPHLDTSLSLLSRWVAVATMMTGESLALLTSVLGQTRKK